MKACSTYDLRDKNAIVWILFDKTNDINIEWYCIVLASVLSAIKSSKKVKKNS